MTKTLEHRGPDGDGFYFKSGAGLGMRRLKIIDLISGDQPISNEDKTIWTVFNGEIYNYQSLRKELEAKGHHFYTKSDTETIVHLYEEYGEDFVKRLNGMFAVALWDENTGKLVLARDRAGEKPLYYYLDSGQLLFASELKAILRTGLIKKEIDVEALHYYLAYGRVPAPFSIIQGVKKLEPAGVLVLQNGRSTVKKYWHLSFKNKLDWPLDQLKSEFLAKFEKSVKSRLMSDVPLGAFLSGGVDSSAVVAMMAKNSSKPVETFSVGFKEQDFSELEYARVVAKKFHTNHHEFVIEPEVLEILPKLVWHLDEPFADASIIPTYYVSKLSRDFVTVALTGDGGDELFAGYEWFKALRFALIYNKLPAPVKKGIYGLSRMLPETDERDGLSRWFHKARRFAETQAGTMNSALDAYLSMTTGFSDKLLNQEVYQQPVEFSAKKLREDALEEYDGPDRLEAVLYGQFKTLLPDMFFAKVDRCSMAVSLETRAPLVDYDLVEFIARIPFKYKLNGFKTKYLFKEALKGILPDEILFRRKKGFSLPLNRWIKQGQLKEQISGVLLDDSFVNLGYFKKDYILKIINEHNSGVKNNFDKIWRLYMFALWHKEFIKQP